MNESGQTSKSRSNSPCCALTQALAFKLYVRQGTRAITPELSVVGFQPSGPEGSCWLGREGLDDRSHRSVTGGDRRIRLREVGVRGEWVGRGEGVPIDIPKDTVGLGDVSTEPE